MPIHPAAEMFPMMPPDELQKLGEDIRKNGLQQAIIILSKSNGDELLLDGRTRLDAMERVGIKFNLKRHKHGWWNLDILEKGVPTINIDLAYTIGDSVDPYDYVISANIHRRHLTAEQRRELSACWTAVVECSCSCRASTARASRKNCALANRTAKSRRATILRVRRHRARGSSNETCRQEEIEMDMTKYAGSKFITVDDLRETGSREEVIVSVEPGKYDKPVVTFDCGDKLGLNKTSVNALMKAYGKDGRDWIGKTIELYIGPTKFNDEERDSVLARPVTPPAPKPGKNEDMDDDIPFKVGAES
jgi:hypothetical protein